MPHAGSLWARLRLSGRKAARWRFQLAVQSCTLELRGRTLKRPPHRLALLVTRKKRQAHSSQYKWHCTQPSRPAHVSVVVGTQQEPIDFQSTLNSKTSDVRIKWNFFEFYWIHLIKGHIRRQALGDRTGRSVENGPAQTFSPGQVEPGRVDWRWQWWEDFQRNFQYRI